jgi:hypothetical protein
VVNAAIRRRIEEHEPPPQPFSPQDVQVEFRHVFSDSSDVVKWLADKPPEWAVVMAARSALRSIPALAGEARTTSGGVTAAESTIILPMFRAVCAAWVAANNPAWFHNSDLPESIFAAGRAVFTTWFTTKTNSIMAVQAAISTITDAPNRRHAGIAVEAAANATYALASARERDMAAEEVWNAATDDARILEHHIAPQIVAHNPLWPDGALSWSVAAWWQLKHELLSLKAYRMLPVVEIFCWLTQKRERCEISLQRMLRFCRRVSPHN